MSTKLINKLRTNLFFVDTEMKVNQVLSKYPLDKTIISYSGGADSDNMLYLFNILGYNLKAVLFDTGIEYEATYRHVQNMQKQGFDIEIVKKGRPVPTSNKQYGHPFVSKFVSAMLEQLQRHNFDFANHGWLDFETLWAMYPNCKSALRWWTNNHKSANIKRNKLLKEFLIAYPPQFKISGKCCDGAKKMPAKQYARENDIQLQILGIRRAEGGMRSMAIKNCYATNTSFKYDMYYPMFWWSNADKQLFEDIMNIQHSDCYTTYAMERTGCAGCPFSKSRSQDIITLEVHEPKMAKAVKNIFKPVYEYTDMYNAFKDNGGMLS